MSESDSLLQHRKEAADLSLGLSDQVIYKKAIGHLKKIGAKKNHLDYGSGQGVFLKQLHKEFPHLNFTGVDIMAKPHDFVAEIDWYSCDLNGATPLAAAQYDSITALEIIEHLENPRHFFRELFRLLKPSGQVIVSTPNNESWRSLLSYWKRGHFVAFTDTSYPAHITALNRKDLLRAAREAGFYFIDWAYTNRGCLPGFTKRTWQGVSLGLLRGLRYSDNLFVILGKKAQ